MYLSATIYLVTLHYFTCRKSVILLMLQHTYTRYIYAKYAHTHTPIQICLTLHAYIYGMSIHIHLYLMIRRETLGHEWFPWLIFIIVNRYNTSLYKFLAWHIDGGTNDNPYNFYKVLTFKWHIWKLLRLQITVI